MKNHHIFLLRVLGVLVAILVFAPTVALSYDVYGGGYDSYTGSYSSYGVDYDNSAWSGNSYSSGGSSYSSGGSSYSSGSTGSSGSSSNGSAGSYTTDYSDAELPSGYKRVTVPKIGNYAVYYLDGTQEQNAAANTGTGSDGAVVIYARDPEYGNPIKTQIIGRYFTYTSRGYIDTAKLPAKTVTNVAPTPVVSGPKYESSAPTGARLVTISSDSYVYDAKTKELIDYAMPETMTGKIYNRDNSSLIGMMLSETTGYLNEYITYSTTIVDSSGKVINSGSGSSAPVAAVVTKAPAVASPEPAKTATTAPAPTVVVPEVASLNKSIPAGAKLVFVENIDGVYTVFDKETGAALPLAFYDVNTKNLYYGNSDELYGKMLTENMGYIEPDKFIDKLVSPTNEVIAANKLIIDTELAPTVVSEENKNPIIVVVQKIKSGAAKIFGGLSGWFKSLFKWGK